MMEKDLKEDTKKCLKYIIEAIESSGTYYQTSLWSACYKAKQLLEKLNE